MNLRGGLALIRGQLFGYLSEKGFFWTLALGWMTAPVIYLLVWQAAAAGGVIGGYDRNDFILYYLCLIVVNQATYPTTHWTTAEHIHNGTISAELLRPVPLIYNALGTEFAVKIVCLPFVTAVVTLFGFGFQVKLTIAADSLGLAAAALLLAMLLRFLLAYAISLLAFWTQQSNALLQVNDTLVFLLAGQVAPLALFPPGLQKLAMQLPYRYMASFPVEAVLGKLSMAEIRSGFAVMAGWILLLAILTYVLTNKGTRKYSATGG
ncbi:ABC transporter permease [Paenibacillus tengchongensis]|uniref:ABC transporter permease n=1 Tax=Paenibacillus tengchongensis TaxID=2608684 RepID=UPI00124ED1A2|nr:ABC-2 family transporter protein [Paenibacillus tengchongensis]